MSSDPRSPLTFRPDLEGLRGVAILLVLVCHAGIPGGASGFIGVDVFFVLSGFLITGLLVSEAEQTGRIQLTAFYARRARRILPPAAVAIIGTLAAASFVLSPLDIPAIADDALAAGLSLANVHFAISATDYFAPVDPSPFLHFWSLSVEEQYYLIWPVVLGLAARRARPRLTMTVIAAIVLVGSLALSLVLTPVAGPWAYFSLPGRAWQLAAGGALALAGTGLIRLPKPIAVLSGWLGAALIVLSLVAISPTTAYPGIAAAGPTLGALGLIVGGTVSGSPGWLILQRAPVRWLGRISYSLYLWHWPVLVLGAAAIGVAATDEAPIADPLAVRLALVGIAVVLAAISTSLVERPFQAGRLSRGGHRRWLATAGAAVLGIAIGSSAMGIAARDIVSAAETQGTDGATTGQLDLQEGPVHVGDDELDEPSMSPGLPSASPSATLTPSATPTAPAPTPAPRPNPLLAGPVPGNLTPTLARARNDGDRLITDGCSLGLAGSTPPTCVYGDRKGTITIALVDSHAASWFPAFRKLAVRHHWRLIPFTKSSCVFLDMRVWSPYLNREYTECTTWRELVVAKLVKIKPDVVVIAGNRWFPVIDDLDNSPKRQGAAPRGSSSGSRAASRCWSTRRAPTTTSRPASQAIVMRSRPARRRGRTRSAGGTASGSGKPPSGRVRRSSTCPRRPARPIPVHRSSAGASSIATTTTSRPPSPRRSPMTSTQRWHRYSTCLAREFDVHAQHEPGSTRGPGGRRDRRVRDGLWTRHRTGQSAAGSCAREPAPRSHSDRDDGARPRFRATERTRARGRRPRADGGGVRPLGGGRGPSRSRASSGRRA